MYTTSVQGLLRQCLEATFDQKWGEVPRTHAPGATYKGKFYCHVNEKKKVSTYGASAMSFFRTKYYKTFPCIPILTAPRRVGAGWCLLLFREHHTCLSKAFASKPQKVTFKLPTAGACRDFAPIYGEAFNTLILHRSMRPNLERARRKSFCACTHCDETLSLQSRDAIKIELKGCVRTKTM